MERNEAHGIVPQAPVPFNSLAEVLAVIEKVLVGHDVQLRITPKMRKYLSE
jgi:hypothetical protein